MIESLRIFDNFYANPDDIVDLFKDQCTNSHICPGNRSVELSNIDNNLYNEIKNVLCAIHNLNPSNVKLWTYFNLHEYDPNLPHHLKRSLPHIDGDIHNHKKLTIDNYFNEMFYAGSIFMQKNADLEAGLQFYKEKPHKFTSREHYYKLVLEDYLLPKIKFHAGEMTAEEVNTYSENFLDHFDLVVDVKNVYNRLVTWKCGTIRSSQLITDKQKTKLIQNFYLTNVN